MKARTFFLIFLSLLVVKINRKALQTQNHLPLVNKRMVAIFFILLAICLTAISCEKEKQSLVNTQWKLVGIVDVQMTALTELEPKDSQCYSISFNEDSVFNETTWFNGDLNVETGWYKIFTGRSSSNYISSWYKIDYKTSHFQVYNIGGTEISEIFDGSLYRNTLYKVRSYSLQKNELRLYYNDNKNYLLFKQIES